MAKKELILTAIFALLTTTAPRAEGFIVGGHVVTGAEKKAVAYASVLINTDLWAVTDENGAFVIRQVPGGGATLTARCLGYSKYTLNFIVKRDITDMTIRMKESSLALEGVEVVARRDVNEATTSYTIDRLTLDNQQTLNISELSALLPGGKTVNGTLMSDTRIALRSGSSEMGNAAFGTAIDIDGARLDNNAAADETTGSSTRSIGTSNIESVEIITGIPSVEYGDLSNGIVKVMTRRGKSPFIVEGKINRLTRLVALNKGVALSSEGGMLNIGVEHARSFSDAASPHTAYARNNLSLRYTNTFLSRAAPMTVDIGLTGNMGGYDSRTDPDNELDSYYRARDNNIRANFSLTCLLNKRWITNVEMKGAVTYQDKRSEDYYFTSSASTQPYIHTTEEGYFIARDYDEDPDAAIILGPTGYWYVRGYDDTKPLSWALNVKATWAARLSGIRSRLLAGADYTGSRNNGRGVYYEDMRYAPTWREYRYDALPAMRNIAFYSEEKVSVPTGRLSTFEITAGLRYDMTIINASDYGASTAYSPRVNSRYIFWKRRRKRAVSDLSAHAGWGKSVKLPSFQVLYPSPAYRDILSFAPGSTADNKSFYAYYTYPSKALYNPGLKWQYTNQTDVGAEMTIKGTRVTVSAFHHKTYNPYMAMLTYTPITYKFTGQSALENIGIASAYRAYSIDRETGVVTVTDKTSGYSAQAAYNAHSTYVTNTVYTNASPTERFGVEWVVDFARVKALGTSLRLDGRYYRYKGRDETLIANVPFSLTTTMTNGEPYQYVGYYRGANATSTSYNATASVANGAIKKALDLNATLTAHIPRLSMIMTLRVESSLYTYRRSLCEVSDGVRGYVLEDADDIEGTEAYDGTQRDHIVVVYPEYYSTWDDPQTLIPFAEKLAWAKENDAKLYSDLSRLIVRSNYAYTMNPDRLSAYWSANISVTKEIGRHISLSFYANNFLNNMSKVRSSQTSLETSLFSGGYIPDYYYGLSLRIKI